MARGLPYVEVFVQLIKIIIKGETFHEYFKEKNY